MRRREGRKTDWSPLWRALGFVAVFGGVMLAVAIAGAARAAEAGGGPSFWVDALPRWTSAILAVIGAVVFILGLYFSTKFATRSAVDAAMKRLDEHGQRIDRLEATVETMPGKDDYHGLVREFERQRGEISALTATLKPVADSVRRIEDYLLNRGGGAR